MNIQIVYEYLSYDNEDTQELDLALRDDLKISDDEWDERRDDIVTGEGDHWQGDVTPIRIDLIESKIQKAKEQGATHIEIMYHEDHHGYYVYPIRIRLAKPEEIESEEERENSIRIRKLKARKEEISTELGAIDRILKNMKKQ